MREVQIDVVALAHALKEKGWEGEPNVVDGDWIEVLLWHKKDLQYRHKLHACSRGTATVSSYIASVALGETIQLDSVPITKEPFRSALVILEDCTTYPKCKNCGHEERQHGDIVCRGTHNVGHGISVCTCREFVERKPVCPVCKGSRRVRYWNQKAYPAPISTFMLRDHHPCPECAK